MLTLLLYRGGGGSAETPAGPTHFASTSERTGPDPARSTSAPLGLDPDRSTSEPA